MNQDQEEFLDQPEHQDQLGPLDPLDLRDREVAVESQALLDLLDHLVLLGQVEREDPQGQQVLVGLMAQLGQVVKLDQEVLLDLVVLLELQEIKEKLDHQVLLDPQDLQVQSEDLENKDLWEK